MEFEEYWRSPAAESLRADPLAEPATIGVDPNDGFLDACAAVAAALAEAEAARAAAEAAEEAAEAEAAEADVVAAQVARESEADRGAAAAFDRYDADGSGTLSRHEISAFADGMDLPGVSPEYVAGAWEVYDANGDGVLDRAEFASMLAVLYEQADAAEAAAAEGEGEAGADEPRGAAAAEAAGGIRLIEDVFFRAVLGGRADKVAALLAGARALRGLPRCAPPRCSCPSAAPRDAPWRTPK
jgi:Ca2+-binding EF-hand superfamily protein